MLRKSQETKPDIVLLDSQITGCDVLEAVEEIKKYSPEVKVVMITRPETSPNPLHILRAGAEGCLAKSISTDDLVKSIELISGGRVIISSHLVTRLFNEIDAISKSTDAQGEKKVPLSEREIEIVLLIVEGNTNREIAEKLFIAESTVKVHVKNILGKLELRNRQQLVAYAVLQNLVSSGAATQESGAVASKPGD